MILQMADLVATADIKDLRRAIAACRNEATIMAEAHATDNTLMSKIVHQLDVQPTVHTWVEDGMPVLTLALQVRR
jgi:hypothetical protein